MTAPARASTGCTPNGTIQHCNGRTLDADGESTVALNLDQPLHPQRLDVPICNLAR